MRLGPQLGPQEMFLSTMADIAIFGGAAGGGKTYALALEPLRHATRNKEFGAVVFRRTLADAKKEGATRDTLRSIYVPIGADPKNDGLIYKFPDGGRVTIGHLEHEKDIYTWQGAQIALLMFDELTHFSKSQFFYMLSRNRSTCGVKPYVRATCNPDADSWVAEFISWWVDTNTGLPIMERAGKLRWFVRLADRMVWGDTREEVIRKTGPEELPKSVTFIPATVEDNKILLEKDPGYKANLKAQNIVEQERLLKGNWKIRPAAGLYFRREWCRFVDAAPADLMTVRYWDLAATPKTEDNDPDWCVGVKFGFSPYEKLYYVTNVFRFRETPQIAKRNIGNTAHSDGVDTRIGLPQDPGQAGKSQVADFILSLSGFNISARPERGDKIVRFGPVSAQCQAGNVCIVRGPWNEEFVTSLEGFPDLLHDDDADAVAGAFAMFLDTTDGLLQYYQQLAGSGVTKDERTAD